ncbi:MAG: DUF885 family protein [bacterium]|nr:MAG: DUF885 family protein [bacterium]
MNKDSIGRVAKDLYGFLAERFPVCSSSDEFVFFPQAVSSPPQWARWDDFSPDSIEEAVSALRRFRSRLMDSTGPPGSGGEDDSAVRSLLVWVVQTLEEQFESVRTHATQPTFALTAATVGLIQAVQSGDGEALACRLGGLPAFLRGAQVALDKVPVLFRDQGVEMARELRQWTASLGSIGSLRPALRGLDAYIKRLGALRVREQFTLESDLLERVVRHHTGSGLNLSEALAELEDEVLTSRELLRTEARRLGHGSHWEAAFSSMVQEAIPDGGKVQLLRDEIRRLREHCRAMGLIRRGATRGDSISIEELPPSLVAVRAADSYNALPGHPFRGGVFYIFGGGSLGLATGTIHPVYRMTAAHEAYPGHHLLDLHRWNHPDAVRRPVEYPLFYEGWACFGEDLMLRTGAFDRSYDRLIIARRRYRHAIRGKADLLLHSGAVDLDGAARCLLEGGFTPLRAAETVRKYALRPAYQMCYTVGRRRFQRLLESFKEGDIPGFARRVLSSGEILFPDLERRMRGPLGT